MKEDQRPIIDERPDGSRIYPKQFEPRTILINAGLEILRCTCEASKRESRLYRVLILCCHEEKTLSHKQIIQKEREYRAHCKKCAKKAGGKTKATNGYTPSQRTKKSAADYRRETLSASAHQWPVPPSVLAAVRNRSA